MPQYLPFPEDTPPGQCLSISRFLKILLQGNYIQKGIVKEICIVCLYGRLCENAGTDPSVRETAAAEKIQTAFDQIKIAERNTVCQSHEAKIPRPQTTVSFWAVFKLFLHTIGQRAQTDRMDTVKEFIPAMQWLDHRPVRRSFRPAFSVADNELIFRRGIHHGNFQIPERIATREHQPCRNNIHMDIFLLNPAPGKPAVIFL